jgi:hypothetical protein
MFNKKWLILINIKNKTFLSMENIKRLMTKKLIN